MIERERKFLVNTGSLPELPPGKVIEAGYFTNGPVAIRVTIRDDGTANARYKVCFKGPGTVEREEYEYSVPAEDARAMMKLSPTYIRKVRVDLEGWELDCFVLNGRTFWMAEFEEGEGKPFPEKLPVWVGIEVTEVPDFTNMKLAWKYGRKTT